MERTLEPELLDALPPDHPDAVHNRRDLRLTNIVMGNYAWFERVLPSLLRPGDRALELGAGTGELGLRLNARGIPVDGLDLWPRPDCWPEENRWHRSDLREFNAWDRYAAVIGNLIFHQFSDHDLRALGEQLRSARVILACEPARRRASQIAYRILGPVFGANHVSLHDAHVSIAAGFIGEELAHALGFEVGAWHIDCHITRRGAYHMVAVRKR